MSPRLILVIAVLTVRETARRRILWVLLGLAMVSVIVVAWGTGHLVEYARGHGVGEVQVRIGVSQVLILIAFMFSFVLAMSAAFLAAPAISADVESGTVLALLARPLGRADLVVGRWLGLALVIALYTAISASLAVAAVGYVSGHIPPEPVTAVVFLAFQAVATLTLGLSLGTRLPAIAAGAITVVLFALSWFAGALGSLAGIMGTGALGSGLELIHVALPTDVLWRGVVYGLEPPLVVLLADGLRNGAVASNPFFADSPPGLSQVGWAVAWVAIVLVGGVALFRRREL